MANPDDAAALRRAARTLGTDEATLREAVRVALDPPPFVVTELEYQLVLPSGAADVLRAEARPAQLLEHPRVLCSRRVEWLEVQALAAVELRWRGAPEDHTLSATFAASGADAAWTTQGRGFLLYTEDDKIPAAERAALGICAGGLGELPWVESALLSTSFAPPEGPASGLRIGFTPSATLARRGPREQASTEDPRVLTWLAENGFSNPAERYPHALCPISPSPYAGRDPVLILDFGVWCFRCEGRLGDGFRSWGRILNAGDDDEPHPWVPAARAWVHWIHADRSLPALGLGPTERRLAYSGMLRACHGRIRAEDPEAFAALLEQCFSPHLRWLRGDSGRWLHSETLEPLEIRDGELACLPWVRGKRELIALARAGAPLEGFTPVRPAEVLLNPASAVHGVATVSPARPRGAPPPPRDPSIKALPFDQAATLLVSDFPGLCVDYLLLILGAIACVEAGGPPALLCVAGPSGAGKTQTIALASGLIEARPEDLSSALTASEEDWRRRVGEALAGGHRPLMLNDLHRVRGLHQHIKSLISLEDPVAYRPLFSSAMRTRMRAPIIATCVTVPKALSAPEAARRFQVFRLAARIRDDWRNRGVPLYAWRATPTDEERLTEALPATWIRARAAEGIVAEAVARAQGAEWSWPRLATHLGASACEDADPEQDASDGALLRRLWDHCRGRDGARALAKGARWPGARGWVDLASTDAQGILAELLPDLGGGVDPRHVLNQTLMEVDWPRAVGLPALAFRFVGNVRGATWVGRFEGLGAANGQAPVNGEIR